MTANPSFQSRAGRDTVAEVVERLASFNLEIFSLSSADTKFSLLCPGGYISAIGFCVAGDYVAIMEVKPN